MFPMQKVGLWQEESSPIATLGGFVEWGLLGLIFFLVGAQAQRASKAI